MTTRIYIVTNDTSEPRLVRAANPAQALRHVARATFSTAVASQDDLVAAVGKGAKVEDATKEDGGE